MTIETEVDESRPIPKSMRHWFEKAGIYQSKSYGLHRSWRRHNFIYGASRKARLAGGTRDGLRHFRVLPHLDRMDICDGYFDRWANSLAASVVMPKTEAEFNAALVELVRKSRKKVAATHPERGVDDVRPGKGGVM